MASYSLEDLPDNPISSTSPLRGKRIVVTRSRDQAADFAARLGTLGAKPIILPAIEIQPLPARPLEEALLKIEQYCWLIFTSVNAVDFFMAVYKHEPLPKVAAIGSATNRRLMACDIHVDFVPEVFTGEQLAKGLGGLDGQRVLLPRARIGRPKIVELLRAQGAIVDDIPLYDTVPAELTEQMMAELRQDVDVITFTSPSSVRNFLRNTGDKHIRQIIAQAAIACIGPITVAEAENQGLSVAIMPDEYTIDGLINAIERYYV